MDYARKIGKSDEPKKWVRQSSGTLIGQDGFIRKDPHFVEDRQLVNWRKWLGNRKKQYKRIKSATGRHQTEQILNSCENVRPLVEMRTLMDYANAPVPVVPDKYRGGPEFWRVPRALPKRGDSSSPDITFTPSKKELNVAPELTYVDLPELIEKEKDLAGLKSVEPPWMRNKYLMKRRSQLSREIELLAPMEPEMRNLAIEGHAPQRRKEEPRIPPITVSDAEEGNEDESQNYPDQVIVLKIEDREIRWRRSAFEDKETKPEPITWNLTFSSGINRMAEKEITFENKGNRVIDYQWREAAFQSKTMPLRRRISPFFFNKTKGVILIGQFVKLKIWYRPRASGVSSELWRLQTDPELCPSPLMFRFWGCAETVDIETVKCNSLLVVEQYLDRCIRDATIREIVDEIVEDVDSTKPLEPLYGSLFLESEIFRVKNPLCFYHPSLLTEFHKIYYTVTKQIEQRWNLSLEDLRKLLLQIKDPKYRHDMLVQFSQLYKECLKPFLHTPVQHQKHQAVYNLLCFSLTRFEVESEYAKNACFLKKCEETVDVRSERDTRKSVNVSHAFAKNSNLKNKRGRKSVSRGQSQLTANSQVQEAIENFSSTPSNGLYKEIFFIRIYQLLATTIEWTSATIDSFNNLNEGDK